MRKGLVIGLGALVCAAVLLRVGTAVCPAPVQKQLNNAAVSGGTTKIRACLLLGADPNLRDKRGVTPLERAIAAKNGPTVAVLLSAGADANARSHDGTTPLRLAVDGESPVIVRNLLAHRADPNLQDEHGNALLHGIPTVELATIILSAGANPNVRNKDGDTPLHFAAGAEKLDIVRELLSKGAAVDAKDKDGETPLFTWAKMRLVMPWNDRGYEVGDALVDKGADVNTATRQGITPERLATAAGDVQMSYWLVVTHHASMPITFE